MEDAAFLPFLSDCLMHWIRCRCRDELQSATLTDKHCLPIQDQDAHGGGALPGPGGALAALRLRP